MRTFEATYVFSEDPHKEPSEFSLSRFSKRSKQIDQDSWPSCVLYALWNMVLIGSVMVWGGRQVGRQAACPPARNYQARLWALVEWTWTIEVCIFRKLGRSVWKCRFMISKTSIKGYLVGAWTNRRFMEAKIGVKHFIDPDKHNERCLSTCVKLNVYVICCQNR